MGKGNPFCKTCKGEGVNDEKKCTCVDAYRTFLLKQTARDNHEALLRLAEED